VSSETQDAIFPLKHQTQKVITLSAQVMTLIEPRNQLISGRFLIVKIILSNP